MAIIHNKENNVITIHTRSASYQMKADKHGYLLHTYYGSKIDESDMSYLVDYADHGFSGNPHELGAFDRTYSLDILPQEYTCFGTGDYRATALHVTNSDGSKGVQLKFVSASVLPGKYNLPGLPAVYADAEKMETLSVVLEDVVSGIQVTLLYGVLEELDAITRTVIVTNHGNSPVQLNKVASMCLDWQIGDFEWLTFHGRHCMERNLQRSPIAHGIQSVGSVRGNSSHHYNPFAVLCETNATENQGSCYGVSFLYSGEFLFEAEKDQANQTRLVCGIHPDNFCWTLVPGESFTAPEVVMIYSDEGFGKMSRLYHRVIREHICRGPWKNKRRPVLINNWEATYMNFTGEKLVQIVQEAAKLDVELFVLDDGWFGARNDDNCALGDWYPNEEKLGCNLKELAERITGTGMKFGLWFEPEAISENSALYRRHPEWAIIQPGRKPCLSRNQLVLDMSNSEVQDYLIERLTDILSSAPISYVKWDMNRSICDKYSATLGKDRQGEFAHRYVLGLYRVLESVYQRFPNVLVEGCSGGGGRFDAGMLYYTPQIWTSDNSDAVARLSIQYGTSFGYPVSAMGAHVSAVPNHQTGRVTPLETRGIVAMAGTFGYELDVTKMSKEEKCQVKEQIASFHRFYDVIQCGDYYRLSSPYDCCTAWETVKEDASEALLSVVYNRIEANQELPMLRLKGLCTDAEYTLELVNREKNSDPRIAAWCERNNRISGIALTRGGIRVPNALREYQSFQIYLKKCEG